MATEGFKEFIKTYLRDVDGHTDVDVVVDAEERTEYGGYCESCYYEDVMVDVTYLNEDGETQTTIIYSSFAHLMQTASQ